MLVISILSVVVSLIYMFWLAAAIKTSEAIIPNDVIVRDNVLFYLSKSRYSHDVNKCEARIECVTPHNLACIRSRPFAASRVL